MAITNAQQYQQLVNPPMKGNKRPGYRGDDAARSSEGTSAGRADPGQGAPRGDGPAKGAPNQDRIADIRQANITLENLRQDKIEEKLEKFRDLNSPSRKFSSFLSKFSPLAKITSKFSPLNNRDFFTDKVLGSKNFSNITRDQFADLTEQEKQDMYGDYMSSRMSGETDAYGNPIGDRGGEGGDTPIIPQGIMAQAPSDMDQEPEEDQIINYRLMSNGGSTNDISLQEAKDMAPKGEFLAYINKKEANMLKKAGGSGIMTNAGIPSFVEYGGISGFEGAKSTGSVQGDVDRGPGGDGPTNVGGKDFPTVSPVFDDFSKKAQIEKEKKLDAFIAANNILGNTTTEDEDNVNYPTSGSFLDPKLDEKKQADIFSEFKANGGRAGLAEGGMPYEGGIMDLESARQMYGLGKLVKKVTRSVKKIAKSPIGKAALAFGAYKLGNIGFGNSGLSGFERFSALGPVQKALFGIGATSAIAGLMTPKEEEEQKLYAGADIADPNYIMDNPQLFLNRRLSADGGLMRTGYQEGSKEPVAKKVMPLLDMDGQEKDYRETGGFVDMGRMEKADDVPARLSKNEFVFTADAVRNAGDGSVDKGAEVMYNMMKNLESGGDVSEESQGLEGARDMFKTSQRLEEVL